MFIVMWLLYNTSLIHQKNIYIIHHLNSGYNHDRSYSLASDYWYFYFDIERGLKFNLLCRYKICGLGGHLSLAKMRREKRKKVERERVVEYCTWFWFWFWFWCTALHIQHRILYQLCEEKFEKAFLPTLSYRIPWLI